MTTDLTVSRPPAVTRGAMPTRIIIDAHPSGCAVCQKEPDPYHLNYALRGAPEEG